MTTTDIERATMARVTWRLLPFLLLLYIISWLDRVNVGFAKLQMNADLGMSDTVYGLGAGIFFLGYGLCEVPSNLLLVRYGARIWIARIMITWGLISAGMMFVQGADSFYVLRFLLGVAEAGFLPGIIYYLSQWFPREQRAKAVSWFMIGIPLSIVFGGPLSGWLLGFDGHLGLHGWQWMFLARRPARGDPRLRRARVSHRQAGATRAGSRPSNAHGSPNASRASTSRRRRVTGLDLRAALTHPTVWLLALIMFCCQTGSYGLTLWVPTIVKGLSGFTNLEVGFFSAIPYIAAAIGMVLIGRSSDRTGERFLHIAIPSAIGAIGFVATGTHHRADCGDDRVVRGGGRRLRTRGPFWALPGKFLIGSAAAGAIALINSMGAFGGFIGPYDGRLSEGRDRQLREPAVPARGNPVRGRGAHAGAAQVRDARRSNGQTQFRDGLTPFQT